MILLGYLMLSAIWIVCAYCVWAVFRDRRLNMYYWYLSELMGTWQVADVIAKWRLKTTIKALDEMGDEFDRVWNHA